MIRESVRCHSCNLVQFKTEKCRRCKKYLVFQVMKDEQTAVPKVEEWTGDRMNPNRRSYKWSELRGALSKRIGKNVKRLRLKKSMSHRQLAELAGTARTYFTKVEHGYIEPTLDTLFRIADALEVNVIELISSERELMSESLLSDPFLAEAARLTEAQQVAVLGFAKQLAGGK